MCHFAFRLFIKSVRGLHFAKVIDAFVLLMETLIKQECILQAQAKTVAAMLPRLGGVSRSLSWRRTANDHAAVYLEGREGGGGES